MGGLRGGEALSGIAPRNKISDVTARPESRRPAQAEPCEAKLYEAPIGLPVAHGSGLTFLKPQAVAQATAWVAVFEIGCTVPTNIFLFVRIDLLTQPLVTLDECHARAVYDERNGKYEDYFCHEASLTQLQRPIGIAFTTGK
jgi:hypothetical protein